jgi:hypothetical protein
MWTSLKMLPVATIFVGLVVTVTWDVRTFLSWFLLDPRCFYFVYGVVDRPGWFPGAIAIGVGH